MFDSLFPYHWSNIKKLMFLKILKDRAEKTKQKEDKKDEKT